MNQPIVLVTGGNRGLGLEVCRQMATLNYQVILTARSEEKAINASSTIGSGVQPLQLDIDNPDSVSAAANFVDKNYGRLDVLINNAGIDYDTDQNVLSADLNRVRRVFETNTLGAWRMTQAFLPLLRKSHNGRIVNVSSGAGALSSMTGGTPAYSMSKIGLNALTQMTAHALKGSPILVNAVCPGWVATDMGGAGGGPIDKGARSIVWAATLPDDGPSGGFFRHGKRIDW